MDNFDVLKKFQIEGEIKSVELFGNGHINKTFKVITSTEKYLLQKINSYVFHNVDDLMRNIYIVSNHLREKGAESLEIIKTTNNRLYFPEGEYYYRVYKYFRKSKSFEAIDSEEMLLKLGEAFGELHLQLSDLDSCLIAETIPDFHNSPKRFENLMDAVTADECDRLSNCADLVTYVLKNKKYFNNIMKAMDKGEIPERIVHNDPKINNILFDRETLEIRAVIDLDTVMPGSCLFDVGDALRSLFTGDNESNRDTSVMKVNFDIYENYVKGYLSKMKKCLNKKELELIPYSVATLALELGMRFLEDYLKGDKYFHISFDDENLVRAKGQFALAEDVIKNIDKLIEITKKYE